MEDRQVLTTLSEHDIISTLRLKIIHETFPKKAIRMEGLMKDRRVLTTLSEHDIISTLRIITYNVPQSSYCLLTNILM